MKTAYSFFLSLLFGLLAVGAEAQVFLPEPLLYKLEDSTLLVRWEPATIAEWSLAISQGYRVELSEKNSRGALRLVKTLEVKPAPQPVWEAQAAQTDTFTANFYRGAADLIYIQEAGYAGIRDMLYGSQTNEAVDSFRLGMVLYCGTYSFAICELSGLGFRVPVRRGLRYQVSISPMGQPAATRILEVSTAPVTPPAVPEMKASFGNRHVKLEWSSEQSFKSFFGYYLERSADGKVFDRLSPLPVVNMLDEKDEANPIYDMSYTDSLSRNYRKTWYRLRGMDYFGGASKRFTEVSGYGYEPIPVSPMITRAEQTEANMAYFEWTFDERYTRLLKEFQLLRADRVDGSYQRIKTGLRPSLRTLEIPIDSSINYYRLVAVPIDGHELSSFPVLVMGQDTMPPLTPADFSGTIDTFGQVTLRWKPNREKDLWGYKIYQANESADEFIPLFNTPITDTVFYDTINLRALHKAVHYRIIALDERNNRSPFSEVVSLKRPDRLAPVAPVIRFITFEEDSIRITWDNSSSADVALHTLFRKQAGSSGPWQKIAQWRDGRAIFFDKSYTPGPSYAYTLSATDFSGMESPPCAPYVVSTQSRKPIDAFEEITFNIDRERRVVRLNWVLKDPSRVDEITIYKGAEKDKMSLYRIVDADPAFIEQSIGNEDNMYFYLQPNYTDGSQVKFSQLITVPLKIN